MSELDTNVQAGLLDIVARAGDAILEVYGTEFSVQNKDDDSPLTQADLAAHRIIVDGLSNLTPDIPIVSEESVPPPFEERSAWGRYWLVDPLDGTKEFVNRNGEFTVNIALIRDTEAVYGVVGVPVQDRIYVGDVPAGQAWCWEAGERRAIAPRQMRRDMAKLVIVASRSHGGQRLESYLDAVADGFPAVERKPVGSSLKLCVLADGSADLYPRLGPTSEWDIAAAHAVLRAAGGQVYTFDGQPLPYNSKESLLNPEFVAVADAQFDWFEVLPPAP